MLWLALLGALAGCQVATTSEFVQCDVDVALTPAAAAVGDEVTASGGPQSDAYDTSVRVGGVDATVADVTRESCDECDACRDDERCSACEVCPACADACASCAQALTFVVPDLSSGTHDVVITNKYGTSAPISFEVTGGADSGDSGG